MVKGSEYREDKPPGGDQPHRRAGGEQKPPRPREPDPPCEVRLERVQGGPAHNSSQDENRSWARLKAEKPGAVQRQPEDEPGHEPGDRSPFSLPRERERLTHLRVPVREPGCSSSHVAAMMPQQRGVATFVPSRDIPIPRKVNQR